MPPTLKDTLQTKSTQPTEAAHPISVEKAAKALSTAIEHLNTKSRDRDEAQSILNQMENQVNEARAVMVDARRVLDETIANASKEVNYHLGAVVR